MLCLTGLPLIFRDEINDFLFDDIQPPATVAAAPEASLDRIVAKGRSLYPAGYVRTLFWDDGNPKLIKISVVPSPDATSRKVHRLAFDARDGRFLGEAQLRRGVMSVVLGLHRDMLVGLGGSLFLGAMALLFVIAIVSGVVVYAPFMQKMAFGTVRRHRARRVRWLDMHNLFGIVTAVWAFVVGVSGAINTVAIPLFDLWRAETLTQLLGPHAGAAVPTSFSSVDAAVRAARAAVPHADIVSIIFPNARFGSPRHYLIWTKGDTPLTSRLLTPVLIDAESGAVTQAVGLPWYLRVLEIARPLHFGDYGGLPLKFIWVALDLVTILVLGSGLYLWFARRRSGRP